jgi:hypothetical protein
LTLEKFIFRNSRQTFFFNRKAGLILCFVFSSLVSVAQIKSDTSVVISKHDSVVEKHSPTKATLLSTFLPGAGQYYNKKYWKIPIIYAGIAGLGYLVHFNNKYYQDYKTAYGYRIDADSTTIDQYVDIYSTEDLKTLKDFYRRNRDLSYIGLGLIYVLNILDADVDAHLFYFNVDDDLSLHVQPRLNFSAQNTLLFGINLTLNF